MVFSEKSAQEPIQAPRLDLSGLFATGNTLRHSVGISPNNSTQQPQQSQQLTPQQQQQQRQKLCQYWNLANWIGAAGAWALDGPQGGRLERVPSLLLSGSLARRKLCTAVYRET